MSKYCYKCGAEMDEKDGFCPECGTAVVKLEKKRAVSGNKKVFGFGAMALIVIAALVLLIKNSGPGFSSPEKAYEASINALFYQDADLNLRSQPDFLVEWSGGETKVNESFQITCDAYIDYYGEDALQYRYKAVGHSIVDKDEAKKIERKINEEYGTDVKLSAVATVDYEFFGANKEESIDAGTAKYAFKYKGKWYFIIY